MSGEDLIMGRGLHNCWDPPFQGLKPTPSRCKRMPGATVNRSVTESLCKFVT